MTKNTTLNKSFLSGFFCFLLLFCILSAPASSRPGISFKMKEHKEVPSQASSEPQHPSPPLSEPPNASINAAVNVAGSYIGIYAANDSNIVFDFCSARLASDEAFKRSVFTLFKSGIVMPTSVSPHFLLSVDGAFIIHVDIDWQSTATKNGKVHTFHTSRILRMIKQEKLWTVDEDQPATDDVNDAAWELANYHMGTGHHFSISDSIVSEQMVWALINQGQTLYVQKYDYIDAAWVFDMAQFIAEQNAAKNKNGNATLATAVSWHAYADTWAGNYEKRLGNKEQSQWYFMDAVKQYQEYFNLLNNGVAGTGFDTAKANAYWCLGSAYAGLGNDVEASAWRENALEEATKTKNYFVMSSDLTDIATDQKRVHGDEAELAFYQNFYEKQKQIGDESAQAIVLGFIGDYYRRRGNYVQALNEIQLEKQLRVKLGNVQDIADVWMTIGALYDYASDPSAARSSYEQAQHIYENAHNNLGVADVWRCLSHLAYEHGDYYVALEYAFKGLEMAGKQNDISEINRLYHCIGSTYQAQAEYQQAIDFLLPCIQNATYTNDDLFLDAAFGSVASLFLYQGDPNQALEQMQNEEPVSKRLADPAASVARLRMLCNIWDKKGDRMQALQCIQQAISISQTLGPSWESSAAYASLGDVLLHQGKREQAVEAFQRALEIAQVAHTNPAIVTAQVSLGETCSSEGQFTKALEWYQQSLKIIDSTDTVSLAICFADIGYSDYRLGRYDEGESVCRQAIKYVEIMRSHVAGGGEEQQMFFQTQIAPYQTLMRILLAQHRNQEAFVCLEQSKARVVRAAFGNQAAETPLTVDEKAQSRSLEAQLVVLDLKVQKLKRLSHASPELADAENVLTRERLENELWQTILHDRHTENAPQQVLQPVSLEEAFHLLPNATSAFVEYAVLDNITYIFVLTKHGGQQNCQVYRCEISAQQLETLVRQFRDAVARRDEQPQFYAQAQQLYGLLLGGPVGKQLGDVSVVCIVPDGPLWNLPFQALQPKEGAYVIDTHTVFFTPSITALREMEKREKQNPVPQGPLMLAVGNPALSKRKILAPGLSRTASAPQQMDDIFQPLPQAESQIKTIAALYGKPRCKILVGKSADEERVKSEMGKYQILQFATHGINDTANPLYSSLLLAQENNNNQQDGMLFAADVMRMKLKARLVVLAACDSGRGEVSSGEGLIGMAWSFLAAGCPRVIASQWQIDAGPTTNLMVNFHTNLRNVSTRASSSSSTAQALRQASLQLRASHLYRHPYYWAPFVLTGSGF